MTELIGRGLRYERGDRVVFDGVDVTARSGRPLAVLGPSGSGKTSLLAVLSGLESPSAGEVTFDGQPLTRAVRRRFATVLQGNALVSLLTATENVEVAMRAAGTANRRALRRAATLIEAVGLDEFGGHLVEELSGGQQQRVAIARALAVNPDVLFADEPTSDQDASFRDLVVGLLFERAAAGAIVVVATHDPAVSGRCADTVRVSPALRA